MKLPSFLGAALLLSMILIACGGNTESAGESEVSGETNARFDQDQLAAQQQRWDEVMAIHDEVMPKMGNMHQLTKSLKAEWEGNEKLNDVTKEDISIAIQELESADEGMWDWMHQLIQLKPLRDSMSHDNIISYLEEQEQSIILVREAMNNSIARADSLLSALR